MSHQLSVCPGCGVIDHVRSGADEHRRMFLTCHFCDIRGPRVFWDTHKQINPGMSMIEGVVAAWNRVFKEERKEWSDEEEY